MQIRTRLPEEIDAETRNVQREGCGARTQFVRCGPHGLRTGQEREPSQQERKELDLHRSSRVQTLALLAPLDRCDVGGGVEQRYGPALYNLYEPGPHTARQSVLSRTLPFIPFPKSDRALGACSLSL